MIDPIETIRIYNPQGKAYYSDAEKTSVEFPVTNSCERSAKLMGDDYVRLVFKLPNKVVFDTYAFIEYDGQTFFLKETYRPTPNGCLKETIDGKESVSSAYYSYDVKFVSIANMLTKPICYRHVVVKGAGGTQQIWDEPEISINGTLETLYQIIIGSIEQAANRLSASHYKDMLASIAANGKFTNGAKPDGVQLTPNTKLVSFSFSGDNIANVCTSVANSYTEDSKDTEWFITEDANHSCTLHFAKYENSAEQPQVLSDYEWENNGTDRFARPYLNGGLKSVEYAQAWSDVPQVIVPYGADRNMSGISVVGIDETTQMQSTFGKRLRLDPNTTYNVHDKNGENAATITTDAHGALSNPNVNTGIETTKFYDDIYPQCHFKITKVEVKNKRQSGETVPEYTCEGIAVDARYTKEYLAQKGMFPLRIEEATTLSVRFESGFLNGREFEIANKTHKDQGSTGYSLKFTIVADGSIEDGTLIPSGNFKPNVGDLFALFNMKMPAEFVSLAKQDLAQRAYEELLDLQNTRPEVKCTSEPFTFMQHTVSFGAIMQVSSELFGDEPFISRVIAYSYKLTSPSSVQFSLASAVMQGTLSEMNNAISDVTHTAGGLEQRAINLSRRSWRDANEVADMLDSITSEMMLVGNERYQFGFTSSIECVDSGNKFASLRIGYGSLQHTQEPYINYANRGLWEISGATLTKDVNGANLDPDTPYYLFAQVADDTNPARLILTTDAHRSESEDDVPYLLLGILSSVFEGRRVFSRTNGYTAIEGGTITTEQIQDAGRNLIIDFQSNPPRIIARNGAEIIGSVKFSASDTKTAEQQLADLGLIASSAQSAADDAKADAAAAQAALDNLEIGGRNLLTGTSSALRKVTAGSNTVWGWRIPESNTYIALEPNTTYTARMYIENHMTNIDARIYIITSKTGKYNNQSDLTEFEPNHNKFPERFRIRPNQNGYSEITFTTLSDTVSGFVMVRFNTTGSTSVTTVTTAAGDYINYSKVKIEKGNKATDWTPAPEDVEASIAESKTYTEGLVTALGDTLQSQIDGVVDSYFMEGVPTTSNAPANEWTTDELKKRHEGDTYTNIQQYTKLGAGIWESGAIGVGSAYKNKAYADCKYNMATSIRTKELLTNQPNQLLYVPSGYTVLVSRFDSNGKYIGSYVESATSFTLPTDAAQIAIQLRASSNISADIADTLGLCINPDAGKSWRWCKGTGDSPATGWHWHEIADSDAVRALQSAAKAQDTADGKRRVFVVQPTPPYEIGDLWAQGSGDGKDILKCKTAKAAGQTFAQDDWESASSALTAAQAAQNSVDNMVIGGENVYTGNDKQMIINGEDAYGDEAETFRFNYFYTLEARTTVVVTAKLENDDLLSGVNHLYVVAIPYGTSGLTEKNNILWKDGNDNYNVELTYLSSIKIYDLGTPIGSTTKLLLYFFAKDDKGDLGSLYPDDGIVYARRIMVQKGNKATAYQPYVEHLTAALKGSTEVAGGLVMTNALMLKDEKGKVTAGMSGLCGSSSNPENVLLWGGGTYQDAFNASRDADYKKSASGTPITTLLKKDGTGKIGIFKISDTQAVIDVPNQGKVVIDASNNNGGMYIKDTSDITRVAIVNNKIGSHKPSDDKVVSKTKNITKNEVLAQGSSGTCTTNLLAVLWDDMLTTETGQSNTVEVMIDNSFVLTQYLNNFTGKTPTGKVTFLFALQSSTNSGTSWSSCASKSFTVETPYLGSDGYYYSEYIGSRFTLTYKNANARKFCLILKITGTSTNFGACLGVLKAAMAIKYTYTHVSSYAAKTIIGTDGLITAYDSSKYFMVQNTSTGQKIYAKGLATAKGTAGSGELYVSQGFIDAFKALCDALNQFFPKVRTVGGNETNALECVKKVTAVKNMLDATSIIANS